MTQSQANLRKEARVVGTPDYMSPEMIEGRGLDLPTIDYWALGVIFFELIVGIPPFNAPSVDEVFSNIRQIKIPWDDLIGDGGEQVVSDTAKSLILDLLNPEPTTRLGSGSVDEIKSHSFFDGNVILKQASNGTR